MPTIQTLQNQITEAITSRFPYSYLHFSVSCLGRANRPTLCCSFALEQPVNWPHGIIHNDRAHTVFLVFTHKDQNEEISNLELSSNLHGLRDKNYKVDKCGWRDIKKAATAEAVVKNISIYFDNLKAALTAEACLNCEVKL